MPSDEYDELIRSVVGRDSSRAARNPRRYDEDSALDLIAQYESGGRNIKQQIVPAGGGYNPSVGKITGPSTASGPWQITNSTWRKRAPREIAAKYPTAMSAPVEVQRAVAGKIYRETGFQDWEPYNAGLRKAIARGELPRSKVPAIKPAEDEYSSLIREALSTETPTETPAQFTSGTTRGQATGRRELVRPQPKPEIDPIELARQIGGDVMRGRPAGEFQRGTTTGTATSRNARLVGRQRTPRVSRADVMRAEEIPLPSEGMIPRGVDPRLLKGEHPSDPMAYARAQELIGRVEPIREVGGIRAGADTIGPRSRGVMERIGEVVDPYLRLDRPAGIKTDPIRGAASLGLLDLRREITPEERLIDPQAEAAAETAYQVGSFAPAVVPYVAAGKVISKIPALNAATTEARIARTALTFGGVELGREAARTAQTGEPLNPQEVIISTAIGGSIGRIAGMNPSLKRELVAAITPQVIADAARGADPQDAVFNALTNLGFGLHGYQRAPRGVKAAAKTASEQLRVRGEGREQASKSDIPALETPSVREGTPILRTDVSQRPRVDLPAEWAIERIARATQTETQPNVETQLEGAKPVARSRAQDEAIADVATSDAAAVAAARLRQSPLESVETQAPTMPVKPQWQHRDFGRVQESDNQAGVGRGRVRVTAEDGSEHVIQRSNLRGEGNNLAVPVKEPSAGAGASPPQPREMNFTQFAKSRGYPSDYDVLEHGMLGPSGRMSKRLKDNLMKQHLERARLNQQAHREFEEAIKRGEIIDTEESAFRRVTKEKLEHAEQERSDKELRSKIANIDSQIRTIENLGSMSHLPNGKLKAKYQRTVDEYNRRKAELLAKATPSAEAAPPKAEGGQKQAWELSKDEFWRQSRERGFTTQIPNKKGDKWVTATIKEKRDPSGRYIAFDKSEWKDPLREHQRIVELALREGKPVPEAVLRDYPDLVSRQGGPTEPAALPPAAVKPAQRPSEEAVSRAEAASSLKAFDVFYTTKEGKRGKVLGVEARTAEEAIAAAKADDPSLNYTSAKDMTAKYGAPEFVVTNKPDTPPSQGGAESPANESWRFNRTRAKEQAAKLTDSELQVAYVESQKVPNNSWTDVYRREIDSRGLSQERQRVEFATPPPIQPRQPPPTTETPASPVRSASDLKAAFEKHFRLAPAEADAVAQIADARAETWAKQTGKPKEEWYRTRIAGVAEGGKPSEGALFQSESPFYSQLARVIDHKMPNRASSEQIRAIIESPQSGVKAEEIKWTGLDDFLRERRGATKQEVQEFLRQNQVEVREVEKSEYREPSPQDKNKSSRLRRQLVSRGFTTSTSTTRGGDFSVVQLDGSAVKNLPRDIRAIADELRALESQMYPERSPTKFEKFQLPGGENYRELLLTLPETTPRELTTGEVAREMFGRDWSVLSEAQRDQAILGMRRRVSVTTARADDNNWIVNLEGKEIKFPLSKADDKQEAVSYARQLRGSTFKSSHFDEPNILAHVRFNDRMVDGKKVLFIEEVQSDWHQKGRQSGYGDSKPWVVYSEDSNLEISRHATQAEAESAAKPLLASGRRRIDVRLQTRNDIVPDAPFKKTWHELAMKRMMRYATENGYDRIAWTTGEQQAERYDLSKQVKAVFWQPNEKILTVEMPDGEMKQAAKGVTAEKLADYIGKDAAQKLNSKSTIDPSLSPDQEVRVIRGNDLKVGGEGMKGFYDQILPSFVNKYGKKWGARVEQTRAIVAGTDMSRGHLTGAHREVIHSVDITPSMKKSVMEGQPLFQSNKASVEFLEDGRAIIRALKKPDVSSAAHEVAHVFRRDLEGDLLKAAESWAGVPRSGKWEVAHEEKFARGFERYLQDGRAPTEQLRKVFQQFKDWLTNIYAKVKGSPLENELSPEIKRVFDEMLGKAQPTAKRGELSLPKSLEKAGLPGGEVRFYDIKSNVESENAAKQIIKERGIEGATHWVQSGETPSAEQSATALELIKGLAREAETANADVKAAKLAQAGDLASTLSVRAKEEGQAIQYLATLAKESPAGAVYFAESTVKRQNPDARLTTEQRNGVYDTAVKLKATEAELETTRTKLADVERLLAESAKRPRREPQVTTRLKQWADQAEKDAKARLAARTGVKGSEAGASTIPLDIADYAIIGAAKMARGTANFAEWSAAMVSEFGDDIKPQLRRIRAESERLLNEQSVLAKRGKVVDEIARLAGERGFEAEAIDAAHKFVRGMSRTDFHREAMRGGLSRQQAHDLAVEGYGLYAEANRNLRQAGKDRRAEKEEPDASPERRAELIAQRDALMRQRGKERRELAAMMKQIEEGRPSVYARLNNQFRGIIVSALGTASRNVTTQVPRVVVEDMTKAFELAFVKGKAQLGWKLKEGDVDPRTRMLDAFRPSMYLFQRNKRVTEGILDEFPVEYEQMFRRFSSDVDITPQTGVSKGVHKALDKVDKAIEIINTPNRFQEFLVRRAVFRGELEAALRTEGIDLNKTVREGRQGEIDRATIQRAVQTALRVTFADSPKHGTKGDAFIRFTSSFPAPINPLTFSRFLYNGARFTLEYQPTTAARGFYRTVRGKPGASSDYAKAAVGTLMLTTAVQAYDAMHKDSSEWYLMDVPGVGEIDIRPYQPFASYIFVAHWIRSKQGGRPISFEGTRGGNVGAYVEGLTGLSARPVPVYEAVKSAAREGDEWDAVLRHVKRLSGETAAGMLTPLKTPKQIIAQFDKEEAVVRDVSQEPFTGPLKRAIPFAGRGLPPLVRNEEVVTQPNPILQPLGIRTVMPDKRTEAEKLAQLLLRRPRDEERSDEDITRSKQMAELRTRSRRGEDVKKELEALPITPRQRSSIEASKGMTRAQETFKRSSLEDLALKIWPVASADERTIIKSLLAEKAGRADVIDPAVQAQLRTIGIVPIEELPKERQREIVGERRRETREQARQRAMKQRAQRQAGQRPSLGYGYQ